MKGLGLIVDKEDGFKIGEEEAVSLYVFCIRRDCVCRGS